ncbi:MAG: hypothetical protein LH618_09755 [Saprospiraceae bacterium]|nr:hypothetical protein [Saprospiraceae bacterium]
MKNKIAVWGTNADNEKVLIALELQAEANKVLLYTFPEAIVTEDFVNAMMQDWRNGKEVAFPEGHTTLERELSVTENLLPDDLKIERGDLIQRAQTEWHFAVLSTKLHVAYQQELAEFKEKVQSLSTYDNKLWDSLRTFWDKVQNQSRERNLFREHADNLRDIINALFEELKKLRAQVQNELNSASAGVYEEFNKALDEIEARITAGGSKLNSVFDDLKQMQRRYRDARMSNEHRNKLWDRLDGAFKKAKERKFGPAANEGSVVERHDRRLEGLLDATRRMEDSVRRDEEDLNFQRKKVNDSEGQLESQIRLAKIKMIEERLNSKREKLAEMSGTRAEVERQANSAKVKEVKRAEKEVEKQQYTAAKEAAKSEIAAGMRSKPTAPEAEEGLLGSLGTTIGDLLLDALDTAKAVASVVADKAGDVLEVAKERAGDAYETAKEKASDALDTAKSVAGVAAEKAADVYETAKEKAADAYEIAKDKAVDALDTTKAVASVVADRAGDAFDTAKEKASDAYDQASEVVGGAYDQLKEKVSNPQEEVADLDIEINKQADAVKEDLMEEPPGDETPGNESTGTPVRDPKSEPTYPANAPSNHPVTAVEEPVEDPKPAVGETLPKPSMEEPGEQEKKADA